MDPDRRSFVYGLRKNLRKSHGEDLLTSAAHVGGYSVAAALLLLATHILMGRMLGPENYAAYGTYLSILLTVLIAFSSIHFIITRFISYHDTRYQYEQITYLIKRSMKVLFFVGFIFFGVFAIFSREISAFFRISQVTPTVILGFILWVTILTPVFEGAFKGLNSIKPLGRMRFLEAFIRIILAVLLVSAGFGLSGALFALALGTVLALAFSYRHILKAQTKKVIKPNLVHLRRYALPVTITMVSFALLINLDIILAKHFFVPADAGVFAAASILAKTPLFIALVLVGLLYPKVTRLHAHGKHSAQLLQHTLLVQVILMALLTIVFIFFGQPIFSALFGTAYSIGVILGFYVFAMGAASLAFILITYLLAVSKEAVSFAMPLFVVILTGLLFAFHSSMFEMMLIVMLVMTALCAYAVYMSREIVEFDYFL